MFCRNTAKMIRLPTKDETAGVMTQRLQKTPAPRSGVVMSMCIIRAYRSIDNILLLFQFSATEPDGSMAGAYAASEVAFRATAEAFCFARDRSET